MLRTRFTLIALLVAALWPPLTSSAQAQTPINSYSAVQIGGGSTTAYGLNDHAQVVGTSVDPSAGWIRAFLWQNGGMTDLGTLGGLEAWAFAINNHGQVVGASRVTRLGSAHAFLWEPTTGMRDLGTLGGSWSWAYGINDAGQVVGSSITPDGTHHAFLWQNGTMVDLGVLAGYVHSGASGVNASGQVVGSAIDASGQPQGFRWTAAVPNGTVGTMVALDAAMGSAAYGVNSAGEAVGETNGPEGTGRAVVWNSAGAWTLPLLPGTTAGTATAINDERFAVGDSRQYWEDPGSGDPDNPYVYVPPSSGWTPYAFLWDAVNGTRDLGFLSGGHIWLSHARAINASGQIAADAWLLTPSPLSTRPSLRASTGDARVILAWSAGSGAESYAVKRSTTRGGPYSAVAVGVTGTSFHDTAVVNGHTYYYVVSAVNSYGESPNSNETAATPVAPPAAPNGLTAAAGDQQVRLSWSPVAGAEFYYLYRSTTPGGPYVWFNYSYETSVVDYGDWDASNTYRLQNGTTYYYVVTARNGSGESGYSNEASATPMPPPPPPAPTGLTATAGDTRVGLSWNESPTAAGYRIKRGAAAGGPYTVLTNVQGTTFTDLVLQNGTRYYYVVSAYNNGGESPNSNEVSATPSGPPPPAAPTNLTASTSGKRKVNLTWKQSPSPGITQNRIYRATWSGGPYSLLATRSAGTSYTDSSVSSGVTYYYVVTAVSSGKESASSNQASAKAR